MNSSSRNSATSSVRLKPWFSGFLERMACCTLPDNRHNLDDLILQDDPTSAADQDDEDDDDDAADSDASSLVIDYDDVILDSTTRQPLSQAPSKSYCTNGNRASFSQTNPVVKYALSSPTTTPSRREVDRWDSSYIASCCPSYAGSTATTASIRSEEEEEFSNHYQHDINREEVRSNATTQVVSHRNNKNNRRNELLTATLASAELRLRGQLEAEEARAKTVRDRWEHRIA
jgi:hypothetical protein